VTPLRPQAVALDFLDFDPLLAMAVIYILAHFDDEYGALPLILRDKAQGHELRFLYNMDYRTPALTETRFAETAVPAPTRPRSGLGHPCGALTGVLDGGCTASLGRPTRR